MNPMIQLNHLVSNHTHNKLELFKKITNNPKHNQKKQNQNTKNQPNLIWLDVNHLKLCHTPNYSYIFKINTIYKTTIATQTNYKVLDNVTPGVGYAVGLVVGLSVGAATGLVLGLNDG